MNLILRIYSLTTSSTRSSSCTNFRVICSPFSSWLTGYLSILKVYEQIRRRTPGKSNDELRQVANFNTAKVRCYSWERCNIQNTITEETNVRSVQVRTRTSGRCWTWVQCSCESSSRYRKLMWNVNTDLTVILVLAASKLKDMSRNR